MYPFERFTERAKKVLALAQQEAELAHLGYIGTEHLLLALMAERGGVAARALASLGVEDGPVREAIQAALGDQEPGQTEQVIPTARVKKVVECAFEEARGMGNGFVGTEHLLLGMLIEGQGQAAQVLNRMGVTLDGAREEVTRLLDAPPPPGKRSPLPVSPKITDLLVRANELAAAAGASEVGLEHLERAIANWHAEHQ